MGGIVNVPSATGVLLKTVATIAAFGTISFLEDIKDGRRMKVLAKQEVLASSSQHSEQSIVPVVGVVVAFALAVAWSIQMSKKSPLANSSDKQQMEVEKA